MRPATLRLDAWNVLAVEGPDAESFLHRLTTRDIKGIPAGTGAHAAWLDPKGRVLSLFVAARLDAERFQLIIPKAIFEKTKALAEKYHFSEKLSIGKAGEKAFLLAGADAPPEGAAWAWRDSLFGETPVYWALAPTPKVSGLAEKERVPALPIMDDAAWDALRVRHAYPEYGRDVDETTVVLEAAEFAVSRGKGCYPGQEIVERILTQGAPARRLMTLEAEGKVTPGAAIFSEGRKVGVVTSAASSPASGLALAYLDRGFWGGEKPLALEDGAAVRVARPSAPPSIGNAGRQRG